jgi:replicative DNA helicase
MEILSDIVAERGILSGICQYGIDCYLDVSDIVNEKCFTNLYNQSIYTAIKLLIDEKGVENIDLASIYSISNELGLNNLFSKKDCAEHIKSLFVFHIEKKNIRRLAAKLKKLEIARALIQQTKDIENRLLELTGEESVSQILGVAENALLDFSAIVNDSDDDPVSITEGLQEYVEHLADNPVDQIGVPTGFPEFDRAIGGGLRRGTINVIGARTGVGKTTLGINMATNIANKNIPVLYLDTEMNKEDHIHRVLARRSLTDLSSIETGKFIDKLSAKRQIFDSVGKISKTTAKYYHKCIAGMPFEEQLSIMRRWILKEVGLDENGKVKDCVIVYDYLKLMTSDNLSSSLQEYQLLGFMMTSLHNFGVKYDIPFLTFIQLNRDGISRETTGAASGSDRVVWLCSNLTLFKPKSDEEIAEDGRDKGNRKLVNVKVRHGAGLESGNYINCFMRGEIGSVVEGETKFQLMEQHNARLSQD